MNSHTVPAINTAWLVLSHASWLGAAILSSNIGLSIFFIRNDAMNRYKPIALAWCAISIVLVLFTFNVFIETWSLISNAKDRIFSERTLILLLTVITTVGIFCIWTLVIVAIE